MIMEDSISIRGDLVISLEYLDGTREKFFENKNLIANSAKQILINSIYLSSSTDYISEIRVGTGPLTAPPFGNPIGEDGTLNNLVSPVPGVSAIVTATPDDPTISVNFTATLSNVQANNNILTEAGLFTTLGNLFSVKKHPAISKSSDFAIHYDWTIRIL